MSTHGEAGFHKHWYVVRCQNHAEDTVREAVLRLSKAQGLESRLGRVLIPVRRTTEVRHGVKFTREEKLFPGYLIVEADYNDDIHYLFRKVTGVWGFLKHPEASCPTPLLPSEIERIQLGQQVTLIPRFHEGEEAAIKDGAFAGLTGLIREVCEDKQQLYVEITILGRPALVQLEYWQLVGDSPHTSVKMQLDKADVVELFVALGYVKAGGWDADKLNKQLTLLPDKDDGTVGDSLTTSLREMHDRVIQALRSGETVEVLPVEDALIKDAPVVKTPGRSRGRPRKSGKSSTRKTAKRTRRVEPSSKSIIKLLWEGNQLLTPEQLLIRSEAPVKLNTVRFWVSEWRRQQKEANSQVSVM